MRRCGIRLSSRLQRVIRVAVDDPSKRCSDRQDLRNMGCIGNCVDRVLGTLFYGEPLTVTMTAGIALVIGGVLLVEFGAGRATIGVDG